MGVQRKRNNNMKNPTILFLIVGIGLIIAKLKNFISVGNGWIALFFLISFVFFYAKIHKRNKEERNKSLYY